LILIFYIHLISKNFNILSSMFSLSGVKNDKKEIMMFIILAIIYLVQ